MSRQTRKNKKSPVKIIPEVSIESISVINLDINKDRWAKIKQKFKFLKPTPERWSAIFGKDLLRRDMHKYGIGMAMVMSGRGKYNDQHQDLRNLGTVGCFLSHRSLLKALSERNVEDSMGHLILEDDVNIHKDVLKKWNKQKASIPADWDIVYLGIHNPIGKWISPSITKLTHAVNDHGNWGTHAYLVRHGALKEKILPWLTYMIDAIDLQYNMKFDEWNVYAFNPLLFNLNKESSDKSVIQNI